MGATSNTFIATRNYYLESFRFDSELLVVSFESASTIEKPDGFRPGWGSGLFRTNGISNLCIKPKRSDWYRGEDLVAVLHHLKGVGFFESFRRIVTYGGSMGGYAALAFADLLGAQSVFSLNPQSTLNKARVPWETRFKAGWRQDWSAPFSEASDGIKSVKRAYIAVDMRASLDRKHVDRILGENVVILNMPYVGHFMPKCLQSTGLLRWTLFNVLRGNLDVTEFHKRARARRNLEAYYNTLLSRERVTGSERFKKIVAEFKSNAGALS